MRLPSVLFSCGALVGVWWWLRRWPALAVAATVAMAASPFQLTYAWFARPYAAMALLGVLAAWLATEWLEHPQPRHAVLVGVLVLVALFVHGSALVMAAGLVALPGIRTDRHAWHWRAGLAAAGIVWAVMWGPSFLDQLHTPHAPWISYTTPDYLSRVLSELVTSYPETRWFALPLVAIGLVLAARRSPVLGRVIVFGFVVPVLLSAVIGWRSHYLLPRSLAFAAWAPMVGLGALVLEVVGRSRMIGIAVGALLAAVIVPSSIAAARANPNSARVVAAARATVVDGDVVTVYPWWLSPLTDWYLGVRRPGDERRVTVPDGPTGATSLRIGAGDPTGRVWIIRPSTYVLPAHELRPCAPPRSLDVYVLECFRHR
jgi:uncharacterized membrane protein